MNFNKAILIAAVLVIALCAMPVSAVWMNGNWITQEEYDKITDGAMVVHNPGSDVTSKYRDMNPAKSTEVWVTANSCPIGSGSVRNGFDRLGVKLTIANVLILNETQPIKINADGTYPYPPLAQGDYMLTLTPPDASYGPVQYARVHCDHGTPSQLDELVGFAVTQSDAKCVPSYTIESAKYGLAHTTCTPYTEYRSRGHWDSYQHYVCDRWGWHGCSQGHWETDYEWDHSNHWSQWSTTMPERCKRLSLFLGLLS